MAFHSNGHKFSSSFFFFSGGASARWEIRIPGPMHVQTKIRERELRKTIQLSRPALGQTSSILCAE